MGNTKNTVQSAELPFCPFCNGKVYYDNWLTHKIFQMECVQCKAHWRTGIQNNPEREIYVELLRSKNPEISEEYLDKKLPLQYWQKMLKK